MSDITLQHSNGLEIEKLKSAMSSMVATTTATPKRKYRKRRKAPTHITSALIAQVEDCVFRKGWTQARTGRHLSIGETAMWRIIKQLRAKQKTSTSTAVGVLEAEQLRAKLNAIRDGLKYLIEVIG